MLSAENEDLRAKIKADLGVDAGERDYLPFKGVDESVRSDIKIVKDSPLIPDDIPVHGFVYEVRLGLNCRLQCTGEYILDNSVIMDILCQDYVM